MASFGDLNRVTTNVTAMEAKLSLNKINKQLGESQLRLSTGLRINSSEDDAAGYAIATQLKSRVAGLEMAMQNVGDAKSVLNMVEGAYNSIMDDLIDMKSLATQGSNATLGQTERDYIADQIEALANNINDTINTTTYNGKGLLDGAAAEDVSVAPAGQFAFTVQSGETGNDVTTINIDALTVGILFGATGAGAEINANDQGQILTGATADGADGDADGDVERVGIAIGAAVDEGDFNDFLAEIDVAITTLNGDMNQLGINQRTLSSKELQLSEAITASSAAQSRIMDTDFAKEQSNAIRLQILQQTATASLAQANMGPQAVLGFLSGS